MPYANVPDAAITGLHNLIPQSDVASAGSAALIR
jgi:hypothetical protein